MGIVTLCLATILLTEPVFNAFADNQQMTVGFITPSEISTTQLEVNPETFGFANSEEIQTAKNEVLERIRALGYNEAFRVLSITRVSVKRTPSCKRSSRNARLRHDQTRKESAEEVAKADFRTGP
jgi:hypothetical protein